MIDVDEGLAPDPIPVLIRRCSGCGAPNDRERAKYCRACGADATRRSRQKKRLESQSKLPKKPRTTKPSADEIERARARGYVSTYIRRGKVEKKPCQRCGERRLKKVGPFHHDPKIRMQFIWLCSPCAKDTKDGVRRIERERSTRTSAERDYFARVAAARVRAAASEILMRELPEVERCHIAAMIRAVFARFHWPDRENGVLFSEVLRNVFEARYGQIDVELARRIVSEAACNDVPRERVPAAA